MSEKTKENDIFSDLANPLRLQILAKLGQKPMKVSMLSNDIGISIQALQRHIDRLLGSGLILRDVDGNVNLSAVSVALLEQIPSFEFLFKFKNYFKEHSFDGIPKHLVQRIGDLNDCKFLEDPMQGWQQSKIFVESAQKFIYGVTSVQPIEFYGTAKELLKRGVQIKLIFAKNMQVAKGFEQKRRENGWIDAMKNGQAEEKFVKNLPMMTGVSDVGAQLMFASTKTSHIDSNSLFYSEHSDFRNWCLELFNYYWNDVEKINSPVLEEV